MLTWRQEGAPGELAALRGAMLRRAPLQVITRGCAKRARVTAAGETRSPTSSMLSRLPQICVVSRIPGLRAALDAHGVNTAAMEWHAELDSAAAQQSLARCEVSRRAENSSTQPWG